MSRVERVISSKSPQIKKNNKKVKMKEKINKKFFGKKQELPRSPCDKSLKRLILLLIAIFYPVTYPVTYYIIYYIYNIIYNIYI